MTTVSPATRPDLWHGAVAWTDSDDARFQQPWRLLPAEARHAWAPELITRATMPAGVRLETRTAASRLTAVVRSDAETVTDVVADGELVARRTVPAGTSTLQVDLPAGEHDLVWWLPTFGTCQVGETELLTDGPGEPLGTPPRPRWLTYGSSITMCRSAAGPSQTWPAITATRMGWDLTCLGFGGQCHLDPVAVRTIAAHRCEVISVCLGINVYGGATFGARTWPGQVADVLRRIREAHPATPLVVISPIASPERETTVNPAGVTLQQIRDDVSRVTAALAQEDTHLHCVDGLSVLGLDEAHLLPDGLHPSPEGYQLMGERLADRFAQLVGRLAD